VPAPSSASASSAPAGAGPSIVLAVLRLEHGRLTDIAAFEQPSMFAAFGLPASL